MTFLEMQNDAIDLIGELSQHSSYSLTKLKSLINRGMYAFVRGTNIIESTIDIDTVANQFEYDSGDESTLAYLKKPTQFRYVDSSSEVGTPLYPFIGGYNALPKTKQYGTPGEYWIRNIGGKTRSAPVSATGVRIGTWPICSTTGKTIRIDGFMWPRTLSDDDDEPEFVDAYHDAPVYYAAFRMLYNFRHLRPAWGKKAIELKAIFDQYVMDANEELIAQDDAPVLPEDVTQWLI